MRSVRHALMPVALLKYRIKREEDRLKREIEERELKEAEELLAKTGKGKKLKEGEKLDKNAIMQVSTMCLFRCHIPLVSVRIIIQAVAAVVGQFGQMSSTANAGSSGNGVILVGGLSSGMLCCALCSFECAHAEMRVFVDLLWSIKRCGLYRLLVGTSLVISLAISLATLCMQVTTQKNKRGIGKDHQTHPS